MQFIAFHQPRTDSGLNAADDLIIGDLKTIFFCEIANAIFYANDVLVIVSARINDCVAEPLFLTCL